jgi:isopenicillin N synthase-like dioxygenase
MAIVSSVSRALGSIRRRSDTTDQSELKEEQEFAPPPGPPPGQALPIHKLELPLILPIHRFNLPAQGWTTVTLSQSEFRGKLIQDNVQSLFAAGKSFFDREEEYKAQFSPGVDTSEEGWSSIPGEKQFITIRTTKLLPEELREAVHAAWENIGDLLNDMLKSIAESIELQPDALTRFSEPCIKLQDVKTATMLRIFRYESWDDKIVAEPHKDLGLLSFVAGNSPGLEVWNGLRQSFWPIEKSYKDLSTAGTVLVGRQLQGLSNGRYAPGAHLVRSYPKPKSFLRRSSSQVGKKFRYSIVFVLRAHESVRIDVSSLTSPIIGANTTLKNGTTAGQWFNSIRTSHYNINTGIKNREQQKQQMLAKQKAIEESQAAAGQQIQTEIQE